MEHNFKVNKKGQSSIEFILLVAITMIYISTIVLPSVELSKAATDDIMQLSESRLAVEKFANTIDAVAASSGYAKNTMTILVPWRSQVKCTNEISPGVYAGVSYEFWLTENDQRPLLEHPSCPKEAIAPGKSICSKTIQTTTPFYCVDSTGAIKNFIGDQTLKVPTLAKISVEKNVGGITVEIK